MTPRRLAAVARLALCTLWTAAAAAAQSPSVRVDCHGATGPESALTGTVSDAAGLRVADALVVAACGGERHETLSDAAGRFTLRLGPGRYELQVVKAGFEPARQVVAIAGEARPPLDITLIVGQFADSVTVVSASGSARSLRDAPASLSVITRDDLERTPVRDLAEVLATVEGITARRAGNLVPGVQVRGLDSAYTLMLIDGQRVNATAASFRGNDYDTGWVPPEAIERVEVVRGPMSSLYGSDAIGGVINIITRRPGDRWRGSLAATGSLQQHREAGDSHVATVSLSGPVVPARLGVKVYGGYDRREADGRVNPALPSGAAPLPGFPASDNRFVAADAAWTPDAAHDIALRVDASRRDHGGFLLKRQAGSLSHKGTWGAATSEVRVSGDEIRNMAGTVAGQVNPNRATTIAVDGRAHVPLRAHVLTVGGESRHESLDDPANLAGLPGTPAFGQATSIAVRQAAAFAEADLALGPALRLTLGNRLDHHEHFGSHNSPRAYVVFHPTRAVTLKGGVARAFKAPTLLQNSPSWGSPSCGSATTGCFIIGSLELEPETSTSVEGSAQVDRGIWSGGVTLFRNELENMIDITNRTNNPAIAPTYPNFVGFLPAGPPGLGRAIFRYQNISRVRTQGLEATVRATPSPAWTLRANYGYLAADNRSGATPLPLVYRPAHSMNGSVDWRASAALSLSASVRWVSAQFLSVPATGLNLVERGGYGIADATAAFRLHPRLTLRGGVTNLTDTTLDRLTTADFNEDGRRFFAALALRFWQ